MNLEGGRVDPGFWSQPTIYSWYIVVCGREGVHNTGRQIRGPWIMVSACSVLSAHSSIRVGRENLLTGGQVRWTVDEGLILLCELVTQQCTGRPSE